MNIDERLEALTHSVELLAGMQTESEKRLARLQELVIQIAEGMARLASTAENHEQRIGDLEDRNRDLQ